MILNGCINVPVNFLVSPYHYSSVFYCTCLVLKFEERGTDGSKAKCMFLNVFLNYLPGKFISFTLRNAHFSISLTTQAIFFKFKVIISHCFEFHFLDY